MEYGANDFRNYELYHHGILGQKWGKRNGPPYPLDASDHSSAEKKAGWRKSLDGAHTAEDSKRNGISKAGRIAGEIAKNAGSATGTVWGLNKGAMLGTIAAGSFAAATGGVGVVAAPAIVAGSTILGAYVGAKTGSNMVSFAMKTGKKATEVAINKYKDMKLPKGDLKSAAVNELNKIKEKREAKKQQKEVKKFNKDVNKNWYKAYNDATDVFNKKIVDINKKYDGADLGRNFETDVGQKYVKEVGKMWRDTYSDAFDNRFSIPQGYGYNKNALPYFTQYDSYILR